MNHGEEFDPSTYGLHIVWGVLSGKRSLETVDNVGVYVKMAERGGFEPPIRFNPYNGLANQNGISYKWFRNR